MIEEVFSFVEEALSWQWLIQYQAGWTALLFWSIDFGVLSIANLVDRFLVREEDRPPGHWSFWMVVIFDSIMLPILGFTTMRFLQTAQPEPVWGSKDVWFATLIGGIVVIGFLWHCKYTTSNTEGDWTNGNIAGIWHSLVLGVIAQYLCLVAIRGYQYWLPFNKDPTVVWFFWTSVSLVVGGLTIWVLMDENLLGLEGMHHPNQLLEEWWSRWPRNF